MKGATTKTLVGDRLRVALRARGVDARSRAAAARLANDARSAEIIVPRSRSKIDPSRFADLLGELLEIAGEARQHPLGGPAHARRVLSNTIRIADDDRLDDDATASLLLAGAASEIGRYGIVRDLLRADHASIGAAALSDTRSILTLIVPPHVLEAAIAAVAAHEDDGGARVGDVATHLRWAERLDGLGAHGLIRTVAAAMIEGEASPNIITPDRSVSPAASWWRETISSAEGGYTYAEKQAARLREWGIEMIATTRTLEPVPPTRPEVDELLERIESLEPGGRTREGIALLFSRASRRALAGWYALIGGAVDAAVLGGRARSRGITKIAREGGPLLAAAALLLTPGTR
jgi:hypothetical protein